MTQSLPLGEKVAWTPARAPTRVPLEGTHVLLRALNPDADAEPLYSVSHEPLGDPAIWTYLPDGPYESVEQLRSMLAAVAELDDPLYFAIVAGGHEQPLGIASYMRITPEFGVIEIGHIWFAAQLRRSTAATEAIYLLARHAFDNLGYRRLEWKCNSLNAASRAAAKRFGFTFEGIFRNHLIVKGRNRDTAWFAITDADWPKIRAGFEEWLDGANFGPDGHQRRRLAELIGERRGV